MATNLIINGVSYPFPATGDQQWGAVVSAWALAATNGMLQKAGGAFALTADVNFGPTNGLISPYFTSTTTNPAAAGALRLAKTDTVSFRNNANSADLPLGINASNRMTFGAVVVPTISSSDTLTNKTMSGASNTFSAIGYSSLTLTGAILNADLAGSIAASKLVGSDIATVGTVTSGTWSATTIAPAKGGTGIANNAASTITISGNFALTATLTATTSVTFPTSGTLATTFASSQIICDSPAGFGSTNTQIRRWTNQTTTGTDITYTGSATNGDIFTINTAGLYAISLSDGDQVSACVIGLSVNSNQLTTSIDSITTVNRLLLTACPLGIDHVTAVYRATAGDVIRVHNKASQQTNPFTTAVAQFRIIRIG